MGLAAIPPSIPATSNNLAPKAQLWFEALLLQKSRLILRADSRGDEPDIAKVKELGFSGDPLVNLDSSKQTDFALQTQLGRREITESDEVRALISDTSREKAEESHTLLNAGEGLSTLRRVVMEAKKHSSKIDELYCYRKDSV